MTHPAIPFPQRLARADRVVARPAPTPPGLDAAVPVSSLADLLRRRAIATPDAPAYTFLKDGEIDEATLTWAEVDRQSHAVSAMLRRQCAPGDRAVLVYPPGLDFVTAFFGCLDAGVVAVPAAPPRGRPGRATSTRLRAIVSDATPAVVLSTVDGCARWAGPRDGVLHDRGDVPWIPTDEASLVEAAGQPATAPAAVASPDTLAFLQYTSGSTDDPRGVMVSHGNLLHNLAAAVALGGPGAHGTSVSWLPVTHDMGLIEGVLQPVWGGTRVFLMSPAAFLQRPRRWLETIARVRAVRSGGPDFAYALCAARRAGPDHATGDPIDLSSWRAAYSGAEPIRRATLRTFARAHAASGFDARAFRPCYGLAEATLVVTSGRWTEAPPPSSPPFPPPSSPHGDDVTGLVTGVDAPASGHDIGADRVSCGRPAPDTTVRIVNPDTGRPAGVGEIGEIWVSGPGVARGYWGRQPDTHRTFRAALAGDDRRYLRTGDLGTIEDGELVVTGRLKDVLIVRGTKHFPSDLEGTAARVHDALSASAAAACADGRGPDGDRIVLLLELDRRTALDCRTALDHRSLDGLVDAIRVAIVDQHGIQPAGVVLLAPRTLPRTTSGKLRRHACLAVVAGMPACVVHLWGDTSIVPAALEATLR